MEQLITVNPTFDALPAGNTVECAMPCPNCGYDLFSLRLDALCPECGEPVRYGMPEGEKLYICAMNPAGVRRLTIRSLLISWGIAAVTVAGIAVVFTRTRMGVSPWIMITAAAVGVVSTRLGKRRVVREILAGSRWMIGVNGIARCSPRQTNVLIQRDEIRRIDESRFVLLVRTRDKKRYIAIPKELADFGAIKAHLATWHAIGSISVVRALAFLYAFSLAMVFGLLISLLSRDPFWVEAAGFPTLGVLMWLMWRVLRSPMVTRKQRFAFVILCLLASALIILRIFFGMRLI